MDTMSLLPKPISPQCLIELRDKNKTIFDDAMTSLIINAVNNLLKGKFQNSNLSISISFVELLQDIKICSKEKGKWNEYELFILSEAWSRLNLSHIYMKKGNWHSVTQINTSGVTFIASSPSNEDCTGSSSSQKDCTGLLSSKKDFIASSKKDTDNTENNNTEKDENNKDDKQNDNKMWVGFNQSFRPCDGTYSCFVEVPKVTRYLKIFSNIQTIDDLKHLFPDKCKDDDIYEYSTFMKHYLKTSPTGCTFYFNSSANFYHDSQGVVTWSQDKNDGSVWCDGSFLMDPVCVSSSLPEFLTRIWCENFLNICDKDYDTLQKINGIDSSEYQILFAYRYYY